ncbi:O-antigen ligase family protein [Clostridium beijerinckii]|uniref:O-antigen ligase family protein n=2 Tax=Clostridium beijerinckii TaxID=1520 RepID=A0AB74VJ09_CLOBE|nr:O-antigen ligase family protein [Clostridium beijerinckii]NRZ25599.1 O-antigen ligase [Clostridium beijerinckii]QUN36352.1 O-antigen ligase family protein [Clostridium beijerinckii]
MNFEEDGIKIINSIVNILFVNFIINLVAFRSIFFAYEHIVFLGHVQTISQFGTLALYFGSLQFLLDKNRRIKAVFFIIISLITMFTGDADSARVAAIIMIVVGMMYKFKIYHLLWFKSKWYVFAFWGLSVFIVYTVSGNNIFVNIIDNSTFSGRNFVWKNALELFCNSPYFGYGIDGALITTFWSTGMNYAHNQIVQNLIDGGVVLCISFWIMMIEFSSYIDRIQLKKYKVLANGTLITFLAIMITDSTTLYCYMFLFLSSLFGLYRLVD